MSGCQGCSSFSVNVESMWALGLGSLGPIVIGPPGDRVEAGPIAQTQSRCGRGAEQTSDDVITSLTASVGRVLFDYGLRHFTGERATFFGQIDFSSRTLSDLMMASPPLM